MPFSKKSIAQLINSTNDNKKTKKEKIVYGTVTRVETTGDFEKYFVKLDGSTMETPIVRYTTVVSKGDRVIVMIKHHEAIITGNVDLPAGYIYEDISDDTGSGTGTPKKKRYRAASEKYVDDNIEREADSAIAALWDGYF